MQCVGINNFAWRALVKLLINSNLLIPFMKIHKTIPAKLSKNMEAPIDLANSFMEVSYYMFGNEFFPLVF